MWLFICLLANQYFLNPVLQLLGVHPVFPPIPDQGWTMLTVGMGGYIVARSGEKIATTFNRQKFYASLQKYKVPVNSARLGDIEKAIDEAMNDDKTNG